MRLCIWFPNRSTTLQAWVHREDNKDGSYMNTKSPSRQNIAWLKKNGFPYVAKLIEYLAIRKERDVV